MEIGFDCLQELESLDEFLVGILARFEVLEGRGGPVPCLRVAIRHSESLSQGLPRIACGKSVLHGFRESDGFPAVEEGGLDLPGCRVDCAE